ncbi:Gti1/Pac2 family-domain-containing protein, partial [Thamnocephalis sphaerospora]
MEGYYGFVDSVYDALILFEAFCAKKIPRVTRRLTREERDRIRSGSVFLWDEDEASILRWTDGRRWSSSRPCGNFIVYDELDAFGSNYPILRGGLIKRALSINTADGRRMHLVSYYTASDVESGRLTVPRTDPNLANIRIREQIYPEL